MPKNYLLPDSYTIPTVALKTTSVTFFSNCALTKQPCIEADSFTKSGTDGWSMPASFWIALKFIEVHHIITFIMLPYMFHQNFIPLKHSFNKKAATPAMIKHGINVLRSATDFLTLVKYWLWHLIHPYFPLQSLFSGNGLKCMEKTNLLEYLVA